jgi:hypothetical protein
MVGVGLGGWVVECGWRKGKEIGKVVGEGGDFCRVEEGKENRRYKKQRDMGKKGR